MNQKPDAIEANANFYQSENEDLISQMPLRFAVPEMDRVMREDFQCAASKIENLSGTIAVDCLTGDGVHVSRILQAGFEKVIGVDLSINEIDKARREFKDDNRVTFKIQEIGEYFQENPGPYDLIHLGSLHHIPDYTALIKQACSVVKPGGFIYILEGFYRTWLQQQILRLDENIYEIIFMPRLWSAKVLNKVGIGRNTPHARMWNLAAQAEVHAHTGIQEDEILKILSKKSFEYVIQERIFLPASRLAWIMLRPFGYTTTSRILARKPI